MFQEKMFKIIKDRGCRNIKDRGCRNISPQILKRRKGKERKGKG